jgi:hypothetical protein
MWNAFGLILTLVMILFSPTHLRAETTRITFDECPLAGKPYLDHYWDNCLTVRQKGVRLEYPDRVIKDPRGGSNQVLDSSGEFRLDFVDYNGTPTGLPYDVTKFTVTLHDLPANGSVRYYTRDKNIRISSLKYVSGPGNKTITLTGEFREVFFENTYVGDPWLGIVDDINFERKSGPVCCSTTSEIDVTFSLFIPANNLTGGPEPCFLGDNTIKKGGVYFKGDDRSFALNGSSRGRQTLKVILGSSIDADGLKDGSLVTAVGQSREYAPDAVKDKKIRKPE